MINKIAVIGAGTMGRGIAYSASLAGYEVRVHDINSESLEKAKEYIERQLDESIEKGYISEEIRQLVLSSVKFTTTMETAVSDADLVIEAVFEILELKVEMFKQLDELAPAHAIIATNTSTMSPTEIAAQTNRTERCIAMHFFNPVPKMKLLEIICGLDTSEETYQAVQGVGRKMGKECVRIRDLPGFAVSRMNSLIGNEAMFMLMEGVGTAEDIDMAMKLGLRHPMGPLELADLVGLDVRLRNMEYLHDTLGEKFRPCPILIQYVKAGRLGRKTGKGFYNYY